MGRVRLIEAGEEELQRKRVRAVSFRLLSEIYLNFRRLKIIQETKICRLSKNQRLLAHNISTLNNQLCNNLK